MTVYQDNAAAFASTPDDTYAMQVNAAIAKNLAWFRKLTQPRWAYKYAGEYMEARLAEVALTTFAAEIDPGPVAVEVRPDGYVQRIFGELRAELGLA